MGIENKGKHPRNRKKTVDDKEKDPFYLGIGERLRALRFDMKLTQEDMAANMELSTAYYGRVERGERGLSIEKLALLCEKLGINANYLLTGKGKPYEVIDVEFQRLSEKKKEEIKDSCRLILSCLGE